MATWAAPRTEVQDYFDNPVILLTDDIVYYLTKYDLYHVYPPANTVYCDFLSYNYYDDYDNVAGFNFDADQFSGLSGIPTNGTIAPIPTTFSKMTRGFPTGSRVRVMDPDNPSADNWLTTVSYYDEKGRLIQTQSQNIKGGVDISSNLYYFQGMLYKNIASHVNPDAVEIDGTTDGAITEYRIENTFERSIGSNGGNDEVWLHKQKINGGIDYHLSAYGYDHLGREVLNQFTAGLNYQEYNIRGFLNHIAFDNYNLDTIFQERLFYDRGFESKLYNGNIAGIIWSDYNQKKNAYGYSYDNLNRLTYAQFTKKDATTGAYVYNSGD